MTLGALSRVQYYGGGVIEVPADGTLIHLATATDTDGNLIGPGPLAYWAYIQVPGAICVRNQDDTPFISLTKVGANSYYKLPKAVFDQAYLRVPTAAELATDPILQLIYQAGRYTPGEPIQITVTYTDLEVSDPIIDDQLKTLVEGQVYASFVNATYATLVSEQTVITENPVATFVGTGTTPGSFANPAEGAQVTFPVLNPTGIAAGQTLTLGGKSADGLTALRHGAYRVDSVAGFNVTATLLANSINNLSVQLSNSTATTYTGAPAAGLFITTATMLGTNTNILGASSPALATAMPNVRKAGVFLGGTVDGIVRMGIWPEDLASAPRSREGSADQVTSLADILLTQIVAEQAGSVCTIRYTGG